ncbi:response regulator transcription factor [Rhodococcus sp. SBT000017]|uniref:response regulator transcription factor n=2 Tax=Rhodococcus TaxID=1827 RepID=UPI00217ED6C3|nr:helix-turn-helix transcriptional regulator [Rhodococcus sp. SBT000017]
MYFYARNLLLRSSPRAAATAGRQGHVLAARCGHPSTPLLHGTRDPALTARERQIASLAASGLSNRDIADAVVLSIRTVETHLNRIFGKLGISTRAELTSLRGSLLD